MPITTGSITKALWPGVNSFFGLSYNERPTEWTDLFDVQKSTKAFEEDVSLSGFGLAVEKSEGDGISYDDARQAFVTRYINRTFALGFIITEETIEDAIASYRIAFLGQKESRALGYSMRQTWEVLGANVYNRAFNSSYTFGDGKELLATDHPKYAGGTFSNELSVAADMSEASLEQAIIDIAGFTNDRGLRVAIRPRTLIIPRELEFEATRILKSELQSGSANNDVNALKGIFPGGVKVNHYLTDADAWFIRTDAPDGMKYFDRIGLEFKPDNDFDTGNAKFKARRRGSFGNSDPRALFGSPGA